MVAPVIPAMPTASPMPARSWVPLTRNPIQLIASVANNASPGSTNHFSCDLNRSSPRRYRRHKKPTATASRATSAGNNTTFAPSATGSGRSPNGCPTAAYGAS